MLEIEQLDLEIRHIKVVDNALADILSRSPPHSTTTDSANLRSRDQIMVHAIELNIDRRIKRKLQKLSILQDTDSRLLAIKGEPASNSTPRAKYFVKMESCIAKGIRKAEFGKTCCRSASNKGS
jgi:hypothetical protein